MKNTFKVFVLILSLFVLVSCTNNNSNNNPEPPKEPNIVKVTSVTLNEEESTLEFTQGSINPSLVILDVVKSDGTKQTITLNDLITKEELDLYNQEKTGSISIITSYEGINVVVNLTLLEKDDERFTYSLDQLGLYYYVDGYTGTDEVITLPLKYKGKEVKGILDSAFRKNDVIKVVYIPSSYETIEAAAFYQCDNLKCVTVPKTIKTIGEYALSGVCTILLEGKIKENFSSKWYDENNSYVYEDVNMNNLKLENNFQYLVSDTDVTLVNYLGSDTLVTIPDMYNGINITSVGPFAFAFNKTIESVLISNNITVIKNNAFNNCEALCSITMPNKLEIIEASSFCYCSSLEDFVLPETLTFIGDGAFNMCTTLTKLIIPESVKTVEYYAFAWCTGLKELYIHDTLENFGQGAIYSCSKLKVYTEFKSVPSTWHENFNPSNRPIVWGYEIAK